MNIYNNNLYMVFSIKLYNFGKCYAFENMAPVLVITFIIHS